MLNIDVNRQTKQKQDLESFGKFLESRNAFLVGPLLIKPLKSGISEALRIIREGLIDRLSSSYLEKSQVEREVVGVLNLLEEMGPMALSLYDKSMVDFLKSVAKNQKLDRGVKDRARTLSRRANNFIEDAQRRKISSELLIKYLYYYAQPVEEKRHQALAKSGKKGVSGKSYNPTAWNSIKNYVQRKI